MDGLYGNRCSACGDFRNEVQATISFSPEALEAGLRKIYEGFNVQDEVEQDFFEETLRLFNEAMKAGFAASDYKSLKQRFIDEVMHNNEVFSAFRTHRMQNDMAARLLDEDGNLKPFRQWRKDIEDIADHYCNRWLQTEYDTAVIRAHRAADWKRYEDQSDVYPNVRWMPTTSPDPDAYHRQYWEAKLTLPVGHPFWKEHRPGDRWNCKCSLRQTDEPATTGYVADFKPVPAQPGLDNNPADDGKLFGDSHPYYTAAYPGAKEAAEKVTDKMLDTVYSREVTLKVKKIEDEIRMNKDFETCVAIDHNGKVIVNKKGDEWNVYFTNDEAKSMKDCIITHNHPNGWKFDKNSLLHIGNSFSSNDMVLALRYDVAEMRVVTPTYTFAMRRPKAGWDISPKTVATNFKRINTEVKKELLDMLEAGQLTSEQIGAIHYHLVWKRIAKKYKWEYTKKKTRDETD